MRLFRLGYPFSNAPNTWRLSLRLMPNVWRRASRARPAGHNICASLCTYHHLPETKPKLAEAW